MADGVPQRKDSHGVIAGRQAIVVCGFALPGPQGMVGQLGGRRALAFQGFERAPMKNPPPRLARFGISDIANLVV